MMKSKIFFKESGVIAFSLFWLAILSGLGLITIFDISEPVKSLKAIQETNLPGLLIHSIHYWSAQFCILFSIIHMYQKIHQHKNFKIWFYATLSFILLLLVMLSGYIIKGDNHGMLAYNIFFHLLDLVPGIGFLSKRLLTIPSGGLLPLYIYHVSILTLGCAMTIFVHSKKMFVEYKVLNFTWLLVFIVSVSLPPQIIGSLDSIQRAPWYLLAFQELLHYSTYPIVAIFLMLVLLILFMLLPILKPKMQKMTKIFFISLLVLNLLGCLFVTFFRGAYWQLRPHRAIWNEKYYYSPAKFFRLDKS